MGRTAKRAALVLTLSTLAVLAACSLGVFRSSGAAADTLSLADLDRAHATSLSCGGSDESAPGEPMWCADPNDPQCMPAMPDAPGAELWAGGSLWCATGGAAIGSLRYGTVANVWPAIHASGAPVNADRGRLERPPQPRVHG